MTAINHDVHEILTLLRDASSLRVLAQFLKDRGISHSAGTWEEMEEKRILPALEKKLLTIDDIRTHFLEAEQYGGSHVFLYRCDAANTKELLDARRVSSTAKKYGIENTLRSEVETQFPRIPTITAINYAATGGASLAIKSVETRHFFEKMPVEITANGKSQNWVQKEGRAANIMRLSSRGVLEVRIRARTSDDSYRTLVTNLWKDALNEFFPREMFTALSLSSLKKRIWDKKDSLGEKIRVADIKLRDDQGYPLHASTPRLDSDLGAHRASATTIDKFLEAGGYHENASVYWRKNKDKGLHVDLHTLLSGEINEFALTAASTKAEYEYVLAEIISLGL